MKFQGFAVRTIGDRKAAAAAVVDQQVDILAWQILEAVALRQFQCQAQHVMREPSLVCGAYRQLARTQITELRGLMQCDRQVGLGARQTHQDVTGVALGVRQRRRRKRIIDLAPDQRYATEKMGRASWKERVCQYV